MGSEFKTRLHDPNGELNENDIFHAMMAHEYPFDQCRIKRREVDGISCPTLVYAEMGRRKHVVYVRVTHDEAEEVGTGPMPLILIDAANQLGAEPHVIRVNLTDAGSSFWGVDELEAELKADTEGWNAILLRGKSMADYLRLAKGKISRIEVTLDLSRMVSWTSEAGGGTGGLETFYDLNSVVRLAVDGSPLPLVAVRVSELIRSSKSSDDFEISTCTCGQSGCAGINRQVDVIHDHGLVLWRGYGLRPRRIFIFDRVQYRDAILKGAREFIEIYCTHGGNNLSAYFERLPDLGKALYEAGE